MTRAPLRRRSVDLVAVAVALVVASPVAGQIRLPDTWFTVQGAQTSQVAVEIERLAREAIGRAIGLSHVQTTAADLPGRLADRTPSELTFIAGRAADIAAFVRSDARTVERLKLEIVNARLGAAPLYLFTTAAKERSVREPSARPRILYAARAGELQDAEVQALIGRALGNQPSSAFRLESPEDLAGRLLAQKDAAGAVDIVAIYDEDPSTFLRRFLTAYDRVRALPGTALGSQQLVQMIMFPTGSTPLEREKLGVNRLQAAQGNLAFAFVRFDDIAVETLNDVAPEMKDGILTVASADARTNPDSLWLLTNARDVAGDSGYQRVRRLLGNAYFVGLMAGEDFRRRCEGSRSSYSAYLLDAQLADRTSGIKALAYWSDLVLQVGNAAPGPEYQDRDAQRRTVEIALRERLMAPISTREGRFEIVSRDPVPKATVREQYSDARGSLFEDALDDIAAALLPATDAATRTKLLTAARARLVLLVEKGDTATCTRGGDLGLFGRGRDPFFYLALVDAYTALESSAAAPGLPAPR